MPINVRFRYDATVSHAGSDGSSGLFIGAPRLYAGRAGKISEQGSSRKFSNYSRAIRRSRDVLPFFWAMFLGWAKGSGACGQALACSRKEKTRKVQHSTKKPQRSTKRGDWPLRTVCGTSRGKPPNGPQQNPRTSRKIGPGVPVHGPAFPSSADAPRAQKERKLRPEDFRPLSTRHTLFPGGREANCFPSTRKANSSSKSPHTSGQQNRHLPRAKIRS